MAHSQWLTDKVNNWSRSHKSEVLRELRDQYGAFSDAHMTISEMSELTISNAILKYGEANIINASNVVRETYSKDYRYYKKGRRPGSRNKGNTDNTSADNSNVFQDIDKEVIQNIDSIPIISNVPATIDNSTIEEIIDANNTTVDQFTKVTTELRQRIDSIKLNQPTIVEIKHPDVIDTTKLGIVHKMFPVLLAMVQATNNDGSRHNIWIAGPAGTGKSSAAQGVAQALGLQFYTTGALSAEHKVLGFENAHKYVTTAFREAWEHGGVFCLDETDASNPAAILALNGALANTLCAFPDKIVPRHKDCVIIATANTFGNGATAEYSGRMKIDAASMDRFITLDWPIDEAFEDHLCTNKEWLVKVRHVRARVLAVGIKGVMITPRASLQGQSLLRAGLSMKQVEASVLRRGMTDAQWQQVRPM